jgi:cytochrome c oxidase subunit 2
MSVAQLWWVMLIGSGLLLALVIGLAALAFILPGAGRDTPASIWIVGGGLVLPAVVLTPLMIYALAGGERLIQARAEAATQVDVLARQWEWNFTYRAGDGALRRSINVLHIPAGQPVRLTITSGDVIHGFWIPRLAGKIDAVPGHVTVLRLMADAPGRYRGLCAEFCGTAHWEMQMLVEAYASEDEFRKVVEGLPPAEARAPTDAGARQ